jgi:hypothetical protein
MCERQSASCVVFHSSVCGPCCEHEKEHKGQLRAIAYSAFVHKSSQCLRCCTYSMHLAFIAIALSVVPDMVLSNASQHRLKRMRRGETESLMSRTTTQIRGERRRGGGGAGGRMTRKQPWSGRFCVFKISAETSPSSRAPALDRRMHRHIGCGCMRYR